LSSALGGDESPVKAHPDTSAISKELSDKAHHHVESVESLASAEVSIEIAVQDVLSHTEDFLGAVFDVKVGKQLVERLSDPNFEVISSFLISQFFLTVDVLIIGFILVGRAAAADGGEH
jgi:hypothetical protein